MSLIKSFVYSIFAKEERQNSNRGIPANFPSGMFRTTEGTLAQISGVDGQSITVEATEEEWKAHLKELSKIPYREDARHLQARRDFYNTHKPTPERSEALTRYGQSQGWIRP